MVNAMCLYGHFLGYINKAMGTTRKHLPLQYLQCNGCHLQLWQKSHIPTGKFDIHEVQLKNIPVKNDSGVSNNSHRKITMDTTNRLQSTAFQGMYRFSLFHFPPILGHLLFNHIIIRGEHQNHLKWPSLSKSPNSPYPPLLPAPKIPPSSGKSSTIKCKIGKSIVEYQLYIFFKVEMFKEVGVG